MLDLDDLDAAPMTAFSAWFEEARAAGVAQPEAMALATADAAGRPSLRMVLLRGHDARGFVFYTNRESRKGDQLAANPHAAIALYWQPLGRQVRAEGMVGLLDADEGQRYFETRARESRISAWASPQSRPVERWELLEAVAGIEQRFAHAQEIPMPGFWGGYRVVPDRLEFWQQGRHRLHDRIVYERDGAAWGRYRIAP